MTVVAVLALACGCAAESDSVESVETHRDALAEELGTLLCEASAGCCDALGYGAPTDACRSSMRNAVMMSIIAAEDQERELRADRIDACLERYRSVIDASDDCADMPAPGELLLLCPDLFTEAPAGEGPQQPICPHGLGACENPHASTPAYESEWSLVFENVCR